MYRKYRNQKFIVAHLLFILFIVLAVHTQAQNTKVDIRFEISVPQPGTHTYNVDLFIDGTDRDSLILKMPRWMPGYYQIMDYARDILHISAHDKNGVDIPLEKSGGNTWLVKNIRNKPFTVRYKIKAERSFVAVSYVDSAHAYFAPANTFLYIDGMPDTPVSVNVIPTQGWPDITTGLDRVEGTTHKFTAPGFDILYDCPILTGNLEELPKFYVKGVEHRFAGYRLGDFDKQSFIRNLKKVVETATEMMGDIPYKNYTFIAIGPGQGGIEHLNNTTISFDGNSLKSPAAVNRVLSFIAHEYFHNYNVKRIRPFELGPFDYDRENRTNLLWVSEGFSVYYQYLIVKRAGIVDENTLLSYFSEDINAVENDPGRFYQSLAASSYYTWEDGPFGGPGGAEDRSISYYQKGPVVGLLFDFAIRNTTDNQKSLDDVMRHVYHQYYRKLQRGFTDAEFQQACESVAGTSLAELFEYVYTTKEPDYEKYLGYAGLTLEKNPANSGTTGRTTFTLKQVKKPDSLQSAILKSWLGE